MTAIVESPLLTRRQIEVLALVSEGLSQAEVAARLVGSPFTVKAHMVKILDRLGVCNSAGAVGEGYRRGLL